MIRPLPRQRVAFTLIELLVAMATLVFITFMITRLIDGVTVATTGSQKQLDADAEARLVLDRLGHDLAAMLLRSDVDYRFIKASGNDALVFYSAVDGYQATGRPLAQVAYRVEGNRLERAATAVGWDAPLFTPTPELEKTALAPEAAEYQLLSAEVFRLEIAYLVDGPKGHRIVTSLPAKITDLRGLVVAIAVLDQRSRAVMGSEESAVMNSLTSVLVDASPGATEDRDVIEPWSDVAGYPISGVPDGVAAGLRVYQRYYLFP